ncbi:pyridoxal phosphate-dependent aminotransferase [Kocuria sp. p3-SID1433]|uniref:pyridoxal phosphate-dependent aminotransferase n=1 Tax=unclassified Kocuria TaxID=2649579 RepID=UPI0021A86B51|nr:MULTISPECIES: pyridoxal phosphate-dependent aminotransferase [unclassified Kocuria]MCT1602276.1 pyridoxal phosphate-dependent aminotransferase [Kocuria sp. p3-SID1428]MCT2179850.1 pyridoxal phosphate-dependent aminotransferase [Kocuria sp. p3-SID1433]
MSERISRRIAAIAPSATLAVDAKAKALKSEGHPIIGFGAGEPDFPTPAHIVQAAAEALQDPSNFRYSPGPGLPELRRAIADTTAQRSGWQVEPSQVVVTNGGKQAVYEAFAAVLNEGDEVLLPAPYWTTYPEAIRLAGGVPVEVFAGAEHGYKVTPEMLEEKITDRTKAILHCSPSNPTGAVFSSEETRALGAWAVEKGIFVIADEIYQQLTYDGTPFTAIAGACPELGENVIVVNGVAKTYAMTGWRVGWLIGPADVVKAVSTLQSHLTSNVNNIAQRAAVAALTGPQDDVVAMGEAFDRRRRLAVEMLSAIDGVTVPEPQGAFYVYPDVSALLGRDYDGSTPQTSAELAGLILEKAQVAVVPGEAFGPSGYFRLSYALGDDDLREGLTRLQDFLGGAR